MDLINLLEDRAKGNVVFPAIRMMRAKERFKQKDKVWNGRLTASKLSFNGCPYNTFRAKDEVVGYVDQEKLHYLAEAGKNKHRELEDEVRKLNGDVKLYAPPNINQIHEKCRFKLTPKQISGQQPLECIELPFFSDEYNMMGFVDAVLSIKNVAGPVITDFKTKNVNDKSVWKNFVKTMLPLEKDVAQVSAYKLILNKLNYFPEKIDLFHLAYYNSPLVGELDAEQEYFFNVPDDIIEYMLDSWLEECVKYVNKEESSCRYKYCQEHGNERLNVKQWIVKP